MSNTNRATKPKNLKTDAPIYAQKSLGFQSNEKPFLQFTNNLLQEI